MLTDILKQLRPTLVIFAALTLLTGVAYPLAVTGVATVLFPTAATGSLIKDKAGQVIGSRLIGQPFAADKYFWSRPSATSPAYNAAASSGSNLGPTNPALIDAVKQRVADIRAKHPGQKGAVPIDLVTASGSGLDPHISPAAVYYQVDRVAAARHLPPEEVHRLVEQHIETRTLGVLGEPRVNVLLLNLALEEKQIQEPKNRRTK